MKTACKVTFALFLSILFFSCLSTKKTEEVDFVSDVDTVEEIQEESEKNYDFAFSGRGIKINREQLEWKDNKADFVILLEEGKYEIMACVRAYDTNSSSFYVTIDEQKYEVYTSNPPLGLWELTARTPIIIDVGEKTEKRIFLELDNNKTSPELKYIQIVKVFP